MDNHTQKIANHWGSLWSRQEQDIDYFKRSGNDFLIQFKFNVIRQYLNQLPKNAKILEIGCGNSQWLRMIRAHYPDFRLYGMDISKEALRISKKYGIIVRFGDVRDMPYAENSFHFVFSWGVVEHLYEIEHAIHEHIRITKPGGFCCIDVPNKLYLGHIEYILGNILFHKRSKEKQMVEDGLFYSSKQLKMMALRSPYSFRIKEFCTGPILPLYKYLYLIDNHIPAFIRNIFGGGAGIAIIKTK